MLTLTAFAGKRRPAEEPAGAKRVGFAEDDNDEDNEDEDNNNNNDEDDDSTDNNTQSSNISEATNDTRIKNMPKKLPAPVLKKKAPTRRDPTGDINALTNGLGQMQVAETARPGFSIPTNLLHFFYPLKFDRDGVRHLIFNFYIPSLSASQFHVQIQNSTTLSICHDIPFELYDAN